MDSSFRKDAPFRSTSGRRPLTTRRYSFHVTHVAECHVLYGDARDNDEGLEESAYYIRRVGGKKKPSKRKRALCISDDTRKERRARLSLSLSFSTPSVPLFRPSFIPLSSLSETRRPPLLAQRGMTTKRHRTPSFATLFVEKPTIDYRSSCVVQRARTLPPSGRKCRLPRGGHLCEVLPAVVVTAAVAVVAAAAAAIAAVAVPVVVVAP